MKKLLHLTFIFLILTLSACGANLHEATLNIALLDEPYTYQLAAEDESWDWFDDAYFLFSQTRGDLPNGVYVSANGVIVGTPTETGNFNFRITVHAIDENVWSEDDVTSDSEWYTLFVTEASTNPSCPLPTNRITTEIYLCLGEVTTNTLLEGESFDLDVNFHVDFNNARNYEVDVIDFTIHYDETLFAIDNAALTSLLLREAATRVESLVTFNNDTPGTLQIVVSAQTESIHKSGRLLDIPFYALSDIAAGENTFTFELNAIESLKDDVAWPTIYGLDGRLVVEEE